MHPYFLETVVNKVVVKLLHSLKQSMCLSMVLWFTCFTDYLSAQVPMSWKVQAKWWLRQWELTLRPASYSRCWAQALRKRKRKTRKVQLLQQKINVYWSSTCENQSCVNKSWELQCEAQVWCCHILMQSCKCQFAEWKHSGIWHKANVSNGKLCKSPAVSPMWFFN